MIDLLYPSWRPNLKDTSRVWWCLVHISHGDFGLFCPSLLDLSFFLLGLLPYSFLPEAEGLSRCIWIYVNVSLLMKYVLRHGREKKEYMLMLMKRWKGEHLYLTHIAQPVHLFLIITCDNYMPQCGFNNIEGADVTFLETVRLAEHHPAPQNNKAVILAWEPIHLPWFRTAHWGLECDYAWFT